MASRHAGIVLLQRNRGTYIGVEEDRKLAEGAAGGLIDGSSQERVASLELISRFNLKRKLIQSSVDVFNLMVRAEEGRGDERILTTEL